MRRAHLETASWSLGALALALALAMWTAEPQRLLVVTAWSPQFGVDALRNAVGSVHHWHPEAKMQVYVPARTPRETLRIMATWPDVLVVVVSQRSAAAAAAAAASVASRGGGVAQLGERLRGSPSGRRQDSPLQRRTLLGATLESEFKEMRRAALAMAVHRGPLFWVDPRCALNGRLDGAVDALRRKTFAFVDAPGAAPRAPSWSDGGQEYSRAPAASCRPSFDAFGLLPKRWVHGYVQEAMANCSARGCAHLFSRGIGALVADSCVNASALPLACAKGPPPASSAPRRYALFARDPAARDPARDPAADAAQPEAEARRGGVAPVAVDTVSVLLCTVIFYANLAHSLTRSP
jgi:hypothetical protein